MENNYLKIYLISIIIRKIQFEIALKYLFCFVSVPSRFTPSWRQAHKIKEA